MELQLILETHRPVCQLSRAVSRPAVAANPHVATATKDDASLSPRVVVKSEPPLMATEFTSLGGGISGVVTMSTTTTTSRLLTHEEALQNPSRQPTVSAIAVPTSAATIEFAARRPQRPASLFITANKSLSSANSANMARYSMAATAVTTSIEGVPIETPTSVVNSLNFDALMDGRTGLTPTNILTPVSLSFSCSSLNTPTMQATPTPSSASSGCSSQQRGHHHHGHLGELMSSPDNGLMKLVSL